METLNSIITFIALMGVGFFGLGIMAHITLLLKARTDKLKMETTAIKRKLNG